MNTTFNFELLNQIILKDGPDKEQYNDLVEWLNQLSQSSREDSSQIEVLNQVKLIFNDLFMTKESLLGHVSIWPHGYAGDYEIIDRIYKNDVSSQAKFEKWDKWFHDAAATQAVRNRKTYFKQLLAEKTANGNPIKVLNLASGPCRDLLEFFNENPGANVQFDCIEIDPNAVTFASQLLGVHKEHVTFHLANIIKYDTLEQYDLIWSAGLFDYLDDQTFIQVIKRYQHNLNLGGEIVIGNFYVHNPSRNIMEVFNWRLRHRTYDELLGLAEKAGYNPGRMRVESEPLGVNLFMRLF